MKLSEQELKDSMVRLNSACALNADLVYDVRGLLSELKRDKADMAIAILQYVMIYLRVNGLTEKHCMLYASSTISKAYAVDLPEEAEDIILTPTYPAEPGESN